MFAERAASALGLIAMIAIAWAMSSDRRRIPWRIVFWGLGIQLGLAVLLLKTRAGGWFFKGMNALAEALMSLKSGSLKNWEKKPPYSCPPAPWPII